MQTRANFFHFIIDFFTNLLKTSNARVPRSLIGNQHYWDLNKFICIFLHKHITTCGLMLLLFFECLHAQKSQHLISRDILFGNPDKTNVKISSDGEHISYLAPANGRFNGISNVFIARRTNPNHGTQVTHDTHRGIKTYQWSKNPDYILYTQDNDGDEQFHIYSVNIKTNAKKNLTPFSDVRADILQKSEKHPDEILITVNNRDPKYRDVYRVNIKTGELRLMEQNNEFIRYVADNDLNVRFAFKISPQGDSQIYIKQQDGSWVFLVQLPFEDIFSVNFVGFSKDNTKVYMKDSRRRDNAALTVIDLTARTKKTLAQSDKADAEQTTQNPETGEVDGVSFDYERNVWQGLTPEMEQHLKLLKDFSKGDFLIEERPSNDHFWVVRFDEDIAPIKFYLYDTKAKKLTYLYTERKALEHVKLAPMKPVIIKSSDGLDLVSYLTVPINTKTPVPLIMLVRGGPWWRDNWRFHTVHQWLANRGYAVLTVNYRGSLGLGKKITNAGMGEPGFKMHQDIVDAANWAVQQGITTQDKVAILGKSYGGYAALVALTFYPDFYACGIDMAGVTDFTTLFDTFTPYEIPELPQEYRLMGGDPRTKEGLASLNARSPLYFVDRIVKPLLIGQGLRDPVVNPKGPNNIAKAMQAKNIPFSYVVFPDEGHGLPGPENNFLRPEIDRIFAVVEQFLQKYLHGKSEPINNDLAHSSIEIPDGIQYLPNVNEKMLPHHASQNVLRNKKKRTQN